MRLALLCCLFLFWMTAAACTEPEEPGPSQETPGEPQTASKQETSLPVPDSEPGEIPTPPDADLYDLTRRLLLHTPQAIPGPSQTQPPARTSGTVETFTVTDLQSFTRHQVSATLRIARDHSYWYVDNRLTVEQDAVARSADVFENQTYPMNRRIFGDVIKGGYDGDPRLTVLISSFRGAAGYYSSVDEYPKEVHPYSNQRLMLYINGDSLRPGTSAFNSTVAHELQHAIHRHADRNEWSWVNEGLSVVAEELNGFRSQLPRLFERDTNIQLTHWEDALEDNSVHYAAAYLFMRFLGQHQGGYESLKNLVGERLDSVEGVNAFLQKSGRAVQFRDVFKDWVVANLGSANIDARYKYDGLQVQAQSIKRVAGETSLDDTVKQQAAKYFDVRTDTAAATISFSGSHSVKLLPTEAHSGSHFWWSNRGDGINPTLTRRLDLTSVSSATLRFWTWFNIERGWDFGYVTVSGDDGRTWDVVRGRLASTDDPLGNSYGPGFTGASGGAAQPLWAQETIDLSSYAGKKVLVRFEYVTDDAVNGEGLVIDDIEVPEIGFRDDAESAGDWDARGFYWTNNVLPQDFIVQVVQEQSDGSVKVVDVPLTREHQGDLRVCCFGEGLQRAIAVVAALAPATTQPANFRLSVKQGQ